MGVRDGRKGRGDVMLSLFVSGWEEEWSGEVRVRIKGSHVTEVLLIPPNSVKSQASTSVYVQGICIVNCLGEIDSPSIQRQNATS